MTITRLTTYREIESLINLINRLDEIRKSLADTYRQEWYEHRWLSWEENTNNREDVNSQ